MKLTYLIIPFYFIRIVKYPHFTPITLSRGTKLWKDAATVRANRRAERSAKVRPTATRGGRGGKT